MIIPIFIVDALRQILRSRGAPGRNRTGDLPLRRRPLYPLSYGDAEAILAISSRQQSSRAMLPEPRHPHTLAPAEFGSASNTLNVIPWLESKSPFPPVDRALTEPNGLLAAGGDLSPERLIDAYRHGIYPWYSRGQPLLWWSPDPRMVLFVDEFKLSRSLAKRIRRRDFEVRVDTAFDDVVDACAGIVRQAQFGTWITREMAVAYKRLHVLGYAHSVESWRDGELVGGLYGLALGRMFFGESMFSCESDASKVALAALVTLAGERGIPMIDCQQETDHLASMGARPIPRRQFALALAELINSTATPAGWTAGALTEQG